MLGAVGMEDSLRRFKQFNQWLKLEWTDLWTNKYDDKIMAENIAVKEYSLLFVEKGEIIHATRDYKLLSFHEVLEKHIGKEYADRVDIDPKVGGWRKFAQRNFPKKKKSLVKRERPKIRHDLNQHQRKGGKGWLNQAKISRRNKR